MYTCKDCEIIKSSDNIRVVKPCFNCENVNKMFFQEGDE